MSDRPTFEGLSGELLDRWLAGECSEDEGAVVRRFLMANPAAQRALDAWLAALDAEAERETPPDAADSWSALRGRLRQADAEAAAANDLARPLGRSGGVTPLHPDAGVPPKRRSFDVPQVRATASWWGGMVAVAATVLAAVFLERSAERPRGPQGPERGTYATADGQRAEVRLADGTRVRLAPASRLRVAAGFGEERRDVYLQGEAYFDVVHDDAKPFTVHAGNATARDIGTAFSVRSYEEDSSVRVVVREGEVAMSGVGSLRAGDLGRLTSRGQATLRRDVDVDALLGWLDGRHAYEDARLGQVLREMRRWYGTDVRLADPALAALPFTGTLEGASPTAAVELVAKTLGLTVTRQDGRVVLARTPGRTPRVVPAVP